jgi:hypothetical protein
MASELLRTCIFCDTKIIARFKTCREHFELFKMYKDTVWCKELIRAENRQALINGMENFQVYDGVEHDDIKGKEKRYRDRLIIADSTLINTKNSDIARKYKVSPNVVYEVLKRNRKDKQV